MGIKGVQSRRLGKREAIFIFAQNIFVVISQNEKGTKVLNEMIVRMRLWRKEEHEKRRLTSKSHNSELHRRTMVISKRCLLPAEIFAACFLILKRSLLFTLGLTRTFGTLPASPTDRDNFAHWQV